MRPDLCGGRGVHRIQITTEARSKSWRILVPTGKHTKSYRKSAFIIGKSTVKDMFNSYFDITRGYGMVLLANDFPNKDE